MRSFARTLEPAELPLGLVETKRFLRIDHNEEDELVLALIGAATGMVEERTRRALVSQTWELHIDEIPSIGVELPRPPLASVTAVDFLLDGVWTSCADFEVNPYAQPARLFLTEAPAAMDSGPPSPWRVTLQAGYGGPDDVPETLRAAIKLLVGFLYENRGCESVEVPAGIGYLLGQWVVPHGVKVV